MKEIFFVPSQTGEKRRSVASPDTVGAQGPSASVNDTTAAQIRKASASSKSFSEAKAIASYVNTIVDDTDDEDSSSDIGDELFNGLTEQELDKVVARTGDGKLSKQDRVNAAMLMFGMAGRARDVDNPLLQ
ncbi:hypothetical protein BD626DRAFT_102905 [Schizophyllum amplum]|uniref:Uncharacterized protein n=1 Tax=Schizophyllum amplum TaxID=97359 RepID=A0A550CS27_9AGAR|nr:hypothetical protein BD626DRAFT_102905 [Auriculariopsis ampla]